MRPRPLPVEILRLALLCSAGLSLDLSIRADPLPGWLNAFFSEEMERAIRFELTT
jgi:hypothetical protein